MTLVTFAAVLSPVFAETVRISCASGESEFGVEFRVEVDTTPAVVCPDGGASFVSYHIDWNDPAPGVGGGFVVRGQYGDGNPWGYGTGSATTFNFGSQQPLCEPVAAGIQAMLDGSFNHVTVEKLGYGTSAPGCDPSPSWCGNGIEDPGEQCDDGNFRDQDCCLRCEAPVPGELFDRQGAGTVDLLREHTCATAYQFQTNLDSLSDGAGRAVHLVCDDKFTADNAFELHWTGTDDDGGFWTCRFADGQNQVFAVYSPDARYKCITGVWWDNFNPGVGIYNRYQVDFTSAEPVPVGKRCYSPGGYGNPQSDDPCLAPCDPRDDDCLPFILFASQRGEEPDAMGRSPFEVCDGDRDGDCDTADLAALESALGECEGGGGYYLALDVDLDGCVTAEDVARFRQTFPQCLDGLDNDLDGAVDFPADTGCASATDSLEVALVPGRPILSVDIPEDSLDAGSHPSNDLAWRVAVPPFPLDDSSGIGNLIRETVDLDEFALHDHVYVAAHTPDPGRAVMTYFFERPQVIHQVEIVQHANGVTRVEGYAGDSFSDLVSVGSVFGPLGDVTGASVFSEGQSYLFEFDSPRPGRLFRLVIRKTSLGDGYAFYRAFPIDGGRLLGAFLTECNDGLDNDGDGRVDYPADPRCWGDDGDAEAPADPPEELVLENDTLSEPSLQEACSSITLGPDLTISAGGEGVIVRAPSIGLVPEVRVLESAVVGLINADCR